MRSTETYNQTPRRKMRGYNTVLELTQPSITQIPNKILNRTQNNPPNIVGDVKKIPLRTIRDFDIL